MKKAVIGLLVCCLLGTSAPAGEAASIGVVKGSYINVRQDPNFGSGVVAKKLRGETYTILFEEKGWRKVSFGDGVTGWIFPSLIERRNVAGAGEGDGAAASGTTAVPPLPDEVASAVAGPKQDPAAGKKPKGKKGDKPQAPPPAAEPATPDEEPLGEEFPAGEKRTSKSAEDYYNEAIDQYEKKRYNEALEANKQALAQAPRNSQILNNMANCFFKLGKLEDAVTNWKKALEVSPKSAKICNNLGIAYYQMDENDKAIDYYKKAILFEPQFPDPYYNLASVYGFKGLFQDALEYYRKFLEFKPEATMRQLTEERIEYCRKQLEAKKPAAKPAAGAGAAKTAAPSAPAAPIATATSAPAPAPAPTPAPAGAEPTKGNEASGTTTGGAARP